MINNPKQTGFTLLEVMVALVIFVLVAAALSRAAAQSTNNLSALKDHQFARWVAHNQLSLYRLKISSELAGESQFAGVMYQYKIQVSQTDTVNFNKINIVISKASAPDYSLANINAYQWER